MSKNRYSVVGHYTNNLVFDRLLHTVDQVLPRRGDTLPLPFGEQAPDENDEAAN